MWVPIKLLGWQLEKSADARDFRDDACCAEGGGCRRALIGDGSGRTGEGEQTLCTSCALGIRTGRWAGWISIQDEANR